MIFNFLTLLSTYLFAFASAAAVSETDLEARGTVTSTQLLSEVKSLTSQFQQLTKLVEQSKAAGVGPTVNFTSTLDHTLSSAEKLGADVLNYNIFSPPAFGLVPAIADLLNASITFGFQFALWTLTVGEKKLFNSLQLTVKTLSSTVNGISTFSNGHQGYQPIGWTLGQASSLGQGLGNLWGFHF